jgi:hypothetical protein
MMVLIRNTTMDIPLTITPPKPHHFDMGMVECGLTKITDISIPDRFFNRMKFSNELGSPSK